MEEEKTWTKKGNKQEAGDQIETHRPPLTYTDIRTGNMDAIRAFAESHDVNCRLEHGTPLCLAAFQGRVRVVRM